MTDSLVIVLGFAGLILFGLFVMSVLVFIRVKDLLKAQLETGATELIKLHQQHELSLKNGISEIRKELREVSFENRRELQESFKAFQDTVLNRISENNAVQARQLNGFEVTIKTDAKANRQELAEGLKSFETRFIEVKDTIDKQLKAIREDNTQQLSEMRKTVDEKLQSTLEKRLGESFKQVSDRLEQVHKGLGEMQTLAIGVGDLT